MADELLNCKDLWGISLVPKDMGKVKSIRWSSHMVCVLALLTLGLKIAYLKYLPCATAVCTCSSQREQQYCRGKLRLILGSSLPHYRFPRVQYWHVWILYIFKLTLSNQCKFPNAHLWCLGIHQNNQKKRRVYSCTVFFLKIIHT